MGKSKQSSFQMFEAKFGGAMHNLIELLNWIILKVPSDPNHSVMKPPSFLPQTQVAGLTLRTGRP